MAISQPMHDLPLTSSQLDLPVGGSATAAPSSIERVLERFREVALRAGAAHGLSGTDLDEVLQDVRIRLWRAAAGSGNKLDTLTAGYIYRAAASAALDLLRRRRAHREHDLDHAVLDALAAVEDTAGPEEDLIAADTLRQVGAALEEVAPNRRAVVRMYLLGYSREEIAALLQWSEAKTRNLLYRGLDDLRRRLRLRGIGPGGMP
jgi:RNA polymerase sigma factor (sigma-70 family)